MLYQNTFLNIKQKTPLFSGVMGALRRMTLLIDPYSPDILNFEFLNMLLKYET